ncbi:hypothetical protein P9112_007673 [Eukaryota sp. TZLM1-RC]
MSNPHRSSIRIGSPLGGSNDNSETVRTDPPTSHSSSSSSRTPQSGPEQPLSTGPEGSNASPPPVLTPPSGDPVTQPNVTSSSSQTPQLGTEQPSGGERSDTSSQPSGQGSTPSTDDVPVVPISLPVPPSNVENFVPLSPPLVLKESTLDEYLKYVINQTDPDSASNKISELLKLKRVEPPSSPIVCAPVAPSTSSTEAPGEGQQVLSTSSTEAPGEGQQAPSIPSREVPMESSPPQQPAPPAVPAGSPNPTTPSQEVPVAGLPDTSAPTTVAPTEVHSTPSVPPSGVSTRGVIHVPATSGQTPQQGHVVSSIPAAWQVLSAAQPNTYQAPSQPQESDSPFISTQQRTEAQNLVLNAGIELMLGDPASIPPNELIAALPPFWGPEVVNDHGFRIRRRIGPYFPTEEVDNLTVRCDPPPIYPQRDTVGGFRTPREGVQRIFAGDELNLFLNRCNPCPFPRFSPGYNASLDIYINRDFRTGWWYTYTTNYQRLYLQDRRPDHCASYFGPEHRRNRPLRDALMNVQENIGVTNSSSLLWVNVDGNVQSYYPSDHDPVELRTSEPDPVETDTVFSSLSIEPQDDQQQDEPMATTDTVESVQQSVVVQSQDPSTPSQVPQDPRLLGVTPSNTPIAPQYSNTLLMEAMASSQDRDRDRQRGGRPRKPTLEANDISDPVRILKFIDRFILLAREVSELRRQLEERSRPPATPQSISRENRNLPLDQRYGNPLHEWDRFRAAAQVDPRRIASCVTPECLAALRAQGRFSSMSDSISAIDNINEEQIWESILHLSQYSTLETARNQLYRVQMNWNIQDFRNRWDDFTVRLMRTVSRSTAISDVRASDRALYGQHFLQRIQNWEIATHMIDSVGIQAISDNLRTVWSTPNVWQHHTLQQFVDILAAEYMSWCSARSYDEQRANISDSYQQHMGHYVRANPKDKKRIGKFKPAGSSVAPAQLTKRSKSQIKKERDKAGLCRFCGLPGHSINECPDPDCQRSKQWREANPDAVRAYLARGSSNSSSRGRGRRRGRGKGPSSSNKRSHKYSMFTIEQDSSPTGNTSKQRSNKCSLFTIEQDSSPARKTPNIKQTSVSNQWIKCLTNPLTTQNFKTATTIETPNKPCFIHEFDSNPDSESHSDIFMVRTSDVARKNLKLKFSINNCEIEGIIDSGASISVITVDLAERCNMVKTNHCINFKSANNIMSKSLGSAEGTLSFRLGSVTQLVHVKHSLAIIPGNNMLLIGRDLLHHLGLLNDEGLFIKMDEEHRTLLLPEAEFDHRISQVSDVVNVPRRWLEHIQSSGCTINLDCDNDKKTLLLTLKEFEETFTLKPHADGIDCPPMEINFHDESIRVRRPPRRLNPEKQKVAEQIFDELVESGFAVPSNHEFSSPVCLVVYPDHRKPRLTGDYSGKDGVNANTIPVEPNLPRISDVLVFLSEANFIGTLDLPKAFWQLKIAEKDWEKTALSIPGKSIMFKRAAFGLKNVPAVFQNVMADIFSGDGVFIYIDDIIIVGRTFNEFLGRLRRVLEKARTRRVSLGLPKCHFVSSRHPIKILGSRFQHKTRTIDPTRTESLLNLPRPKTVKDARSLIGSVNFIREWLPQVTKHVAPIIKLTHGKPRRLQWKDTHDHHLAEIKRLIAEHMPLNLPPVDNQVLISCDASDIAVGGVIWEQLEPTKDPGTSLLNRKCRPISFFSRLLTNSQQNWPTVQKELYAILLMLTESGFENYLKGRRLIIFTDHQNLTYMLTAPNKNRIVRRWLPIFSEFLFDIVHTKGEENHWADMLSRIVPPQDNHTINHLVHSNDQEFHPIYYTNRIDETECSSFKTDAPMTFHSSSHGSARSGPNKKRALANQDTSFNNCTLDSRLDLYLTPEHKIVIPQSLVKDTLNLLHGLPQGGHPSKAESLLRLKNSDYWWPNMLSDMTKHVQECPSCQKTAAVPKLHVPTTGSLWADRPFARVNVDVIGPLPEDQDGHRYILVFVDSFTRFTIIVPLKELNANLTADALIWKVCAIFGIPFIVHSDNGPEFSKAVFDALCEFLGIEVSKSVPHFSQSNGLVERRHRDILQNLRKLLVDFNAYDAWSEYIPYVQLLINSSKSSITGYSPYELMFGSDFSPRADPGKIIETLESSTSESTYINNIQSKFARLKKKQEEAELRQASKAPPRDSQIEANPFSPGQLVKRASSSTAKLHGNYKGPFLVIDTPSTSTADIKNLCTGMVVKASVKHLQPWHSSLPVDDEFHSWVAAGDAEEHVIQKVLSQDGDYCQVQWPGNHITTELVSTVQNTSAYKEFSKSVSNTRSRPSRRKRRSVNINNNVNPTPIRPRRSKRRKGSVSLG